MPEVNSDASDAVRPEAAAPDTAVPDTAVPDTVWPELMVSGGSPSDAAAADPAVRAILDQVKTVPGLPVSEHPEAYAAMHDALLEALNTEALNAEATNAEPPNTEPQHGEPQPGRGVA